MTHPVSAAAAVAHHSDVRADHPPKQSIKRVAGASLAGTTLEYYDHFVYGSAAALVFPTVFFSQQSPMTATLLSLASYSVAYFARPLGAALFGHFGDKSDNCNRLLKQTRFRLRCLRRFQLFRRLTIALPYSMFVTRKLL